MLKHIKEVVKHTALCYVKLPTGQFPVTGFSEVFTRFSTSPCRSTTMKAQEYSWKPVINENSGILHSATPLGSSSAADTQCVFISVYLCQLGGHRQCAFPCLSNTMVFDKQGRQGCGRQISVPGKELLG